MTVIAYVDPFIDYDYDMYHAQDSEPKPLPKLTPEQKEAANRCFKTSENPFEVLTCIKKSVTHSLLK